MIFDRKGESFTFFFFDFPLSGLAEDKEGFSLKRFFHQLDYNEAPSELILVGFLTC